MRVAKPYGPAQMILDGTPGAAEIESERPSYTGAPRPVCHCDHGARAHPNNRGTRACILCHCLEFHPQEASRA